MKFGLISISKLFKLLLTLEIALLPSFSPSLTWNSRETAVTCKRAESPSRYMDHTHEFSFTHTVCAHTYSPFCPTSPGSPGGKQPFSCKTLCNFLFLNSLKMLTNMPFGPGAPRSPFSEYASVSAGRCCQLWSILLQLLELACHSKSICDFCFVFVYLSQHLSVVQS